MKITDFLHPDRILPDMSATSKDEALRELSTCLVSELEGVDVDQLVHVLQQRESLGSTGLGEGLAIPHGKLRTIQRVHSCFGRSRAGVEFGSRDGKPAHLFFLLVAPESSSVLHLKALARVSRLLRDPGCRGHLTVAAGREEIYGSLCEGDGSV